MRVHSLVRRRSGSGVSAVAVYGVKWLCTASIPSPSADDEAANSGGPFGGQPPPLFGGERRRRTECITRRAGPCKSPFNTRPTTNAKAPMLRGPIGPVGFMRCWAAFLLGLSASFCFSENNHVLRAVHVLRNYCYPLSVWRNNSFTFQEMRIHLIPMRGKPTSHHSQCCAIRHRRSV
jgi:hypothetical protein